MTLEEALVFCGATIVAVTVMAWWVLRPFERERRERRRAGHAAE